MTQRGTTKQQKKFKSARKYLLKSKKTKPNKKDVQKICWISVNILFIQAKTVTQAYKALKKMYMAYVVFLDSKDYKV